MPIPNEGLPGQEACLLLFIDSASTGYLASWGGMRATAAAAAVATVERSTAHIVDSRSVIGRATTFAVNIDMPRKC